MTLRSLARLTATLLLTTAAAAFADEASVRKAFSERFPKAAVESVTRLPELDLYEVVVARGDEPIIIYTDEKFRYMFQGSLVETKNMSDLTEKTRTRLTAIDFDSLPLDRAIKRVAQGAGLLQVEKVPGVQEIEDAVGEHHLASVRPQLGAGRHGLFKGEELGILEVHDGARTSHGTRRM